MVARLLLFRSAFEIRSQPTQCGTLKLARGGHPAPLRTPRLMALPRDPGQAIEPGTSRGGQAGPPPPRAREPSSPAPQRQVGAPTPGRVRSPSGPGGKLPEGTLTGTDGLDAEGRGER